MTAKLDLTDPAVRLMINRNHQPEEVWTIDGELHSIECEQCHHAWPCPTRRSLTQYDHEHREFY